MRSLPLSLFLIFAALESCSAGGHGTVPNVTGPASKPTVKVCVTESTAPVAFGLPVPNITVYPPFPNCGTLTLKTVNSRVYASNLPWIGVVTCSEKNGVVVNNADTSCVFVNGEFDYAVHPPQGPDDTPGGPVSKLVREPPWFYPVDCSRQCH